MRIINLINICATFMLISSGAFSQTVSADSISSYFYTQSYVFPQEKIYAHTDRSDYLINDTIWFRSYLVNAQTHIPDPESNFVYAELINPAGEVAKRVKVKKQDNVFAGYMHLNEDLPSGNYQLRFYTSYMTNLSESYFFKRNIRIGNYMSVKYGIEPEFLTGENRDDISVRLRFFDKESSNTLIPQELYLYVNEENKNSIKMGDDETVSFRLRPEEIHKESILVEYLINGQIQKEFIEIKDNKSDYNISFFPEGGNLLFGATNKIAFKALNSEGLGEDISGVVVNASGDTLNTFRSTHLGMGIITMNISSREPLYAVCHNSEGLEKRVQLPAVEDGKPSLRADWRNNNLLISVNKPEGYIMPEKQYLLLHCRGEVIYSGPWESERAIVGLPGNNLPSGVLHIMLLDEELNPLSERLVFNINELDVTTTEIKTDKSSYGHRERVGVTVTASDASGQPLSGSFSVSVTDNEIVTYDHTVNILSTLLLTSDLQGYIESPADYFTSRVENQRNLDILMMTQGWRRYDVRKILKREYEFPTHGMEVNQEIAGIVYRGVGRSRGAEDYPVTLFAMDHAQTAETLTDANGRFVFRNLSFPDSTRFIVQGNTPKGGAGVKIEVDDILAPESSFIPFGRLKESKELTEPEKKEDFYRSINQRSNLVAGMRHYQLQEVVVTARKKQTESKSTHWARSEFSKKVTAKEIEVLRPSSLLELFMLTPGLGIRGDQVYISRYFDYNSTNVPATLIIVDGVETLSQHLNGIMPQNISSIEVLHEPLSFVLGPKGKGGAILITTKGIDEISIPVESENISFITPLGYQVTREFYSPAYDTRAKVESGIPDERVTIYWNPNVELDNQGKGYFEFYTSDSDKKHTIVVEGMTEDGISFHLLSP